MENECQNNSISSQELAKLVFPVFAIDSLISENNRTDYAYSFVPTDIVSLMSSYFKLYKIDDEDISDIDLILNTHDFFDNFEYWKDNFAFYLSEEFNNLTEPIEMDFNNNYIGIKYNKEDFAFLLELEPKLLSQLIDMYRWVIWEKNRRSVMNNYDETPINIKKYVPKK